MKIILVSHTDNPIRTALILWYASKGEESYKDVFHRADDEWASDQLDTFRAILAQEIPVMENIVFNFMAEDVPISWREQAVRHRVGTKFGDNFGVDIVPDDDTTFWSQSMRIQSMENFAEDGKYHVPESVKERTNQVLRDKYEWAEWRIESLYNDPVKWHPDAIASQLPVETPYWEYVQTMHVIQEAYTSLVKTGVPMEDARNVIPLGATHRISMSVNLRALSHIIGKRGCWILQSSLWSPVIRGMIDELERKVHPIFRELIHPPCVKNGCYIGCQFVEENRRRLVGLDALPLCPLYVTESNVWPSDEQVAETAKRIPEYAKLWDQPQLVNGEWTWKER